MIQNRTSSRLALFAATCLLMSGTNRCHATTIPLHIEVTHDHGIVAESGPTPVNPIVLTPPLPSSAATPNDYLRLSAVTPDLYFADTGWQASSTLVINGNEIFWAINTGPSDDLFVGDALMPMEHSVELGSLPAGDYVLRTNWFDTDYLTSTLVLTGTAVTPFSVVPEPSTLALLGCLAVAGCSLGRFRRAGHQATVDLCAESVLP